MLVGAVEISWEAKVILKNRLILAGVAAMLAAAGDVRSVGQESRGGLVERILRDCDVCSRCSTMIPSNITAVKVAS